MSVQKSLKLIPYGITGFKKLRSDNYVYVDKTRYVELLEKQGILYPFVVRPRRFGKSLFADTLRAYYDINEATDFEKNFRGTYISSHKTPLANQFYILRFVFSGIDGDDVPRRFYNAVRNGLTRFFNAYPHSRQQEVLSADLGSAADLLDAFFSILGTDYCQKLCVIIDEYDQFANALLSKNAALFRSITSSNGFLKNFYSRLKTEADDSGAVARIFITGVTTISLDSMSSGFSIANNLTAHPMFAGLCGFSEDELRAMIPEVLDLDTCGKSVDDIVARMKEWYNGYRFSPLKSESVFNASMCFYYLQALQTTGEEPSPLLDTAFAQDLEKISGILTLGEPAFVKSVVSQALRGEALSFPSGSLQQLNLNLTNRLTDEEVLSALVYFGYLTFAEGNRYALVVPNRAVAIQFFEYYQRYLLASTSFTFSLKTFSDAYRALGAGDPEPLFRAAAGRFASESGIHESLHLTESDFHTLLSAALYFTEDYRVHREVEARGGPHPGYIDLVIEPARGKSGFTYVVELKYLTRQEGTEKAVQATLKKALQQVRGYSECDNIRSIQSLKRVAAVFVGTELKALAVED